MSPPPTTKLALRLAAIKAQGGKLIPNVAPQGQSNSNYRIDSRGLVINRANGTSADARLIPPQGPFDQQMTLLAGIVPEAAVAVKAKKTHPSQALTTAAGQTDRAVAAAIATTTKDTPELAPQASLLTWSAELILSGVAHEGQVLNILHYWGWHRIESAMKAQAKGSSKKFDTYRGLKLIDSVADAFLGESGIDLRRLPPTLPIDSIRFWSAELDAVGGDAEKLSAKLLRRMAHFGLTAKDVVETVNECRGKIKQWDREWAGQIFKLKTHHA